MAVERLLRIAFGKGGDSDSYVGNGWSLDEVGYRWMIGAVSELRIGQIDPGGKVLLILDVEPFVRPPVVAKQRLTISIDGVPFVDTELTVGGAYGYLIPPELLPRTGEAGLVFDHPDAARPSELSLAPDHRQLAVSVKQIELVRLSGPDAGSIVGAGGIALAAVAPRAGLSPDKLVGNFESLGDNCEFGLVQRRCGAEPLSLLRFANTLLPALLRGLRTAFAGLGEIDDLEFRLEGKAKAEYIIEERQFGLTYHTFRYSGEIDEAKFVATEAARLKFLVRKFFEDLKAGEKIFVCKRNIPLREEDVLPILAAMGAYGDSTLLWVVPADADHPPGTVERVMPGLLRGYIDRFAPNENAHDLSLDVWLELCVNARELVGP